MLEIFKANRRFIYALLSMPVIGMFIATGLILYKRPSNMTIVLGVIGFLVVQYVFTVYFFIQRFNKLSKEKNGNSLKKEKNVSEGTNEGSKIRN